MKKIVYALGFLALSFNLSAAEPSHSAVGSDSCALMKGKTEPFILALRKGEVVQSAIEKCANDAELAGASLYGLGAVQPVTLRYFDHIEKTYFDKEIKDFMEVTNLTGNISFVNGKRQNHIHITLSDHHFQTQAGHLKDAVVGAVLEIQIIPLANPVNKYHDDETGLDIIQTPLP